MCLKLCLFCLLSRVHILLPCIDLSCVTQQSVKMTTWKSIHNLVRQISKKHFPNGLENHIKAGLRQLMESRIESFHGVLDGRFAHQWHCVEDRDCIASRMRIPMLTRCTGCWNKRYKSNS